ncbi:radical SAM family heme chaperone HemW [Fulvivirgaceae bacterium BMA10]|uniref:Heme chaperone HemW n=1 Tax=Splendidivirga corallicola TaxID=3051826 RepID=A0ABT8KX57_9BACT|nr:radical SAM family heme chaperone HemW [Fulvivirgaceae bacterium BMA10]
MAGIYIHIPFCKQACYYCDFHFSTNNRFVSRMVNALRKEIDLRKDYFGREPVETIYLGGGTPSMLSERDLSSVFDQLNRLFKIEDVSEITIEANPDDLTKEKLIILRDLGINRLSIGIQSFNDEVLKFMNRAHDSSQAIKCLTLAHDHGFENISIDLIYGIPQSSDAVWQADLKLAMQLAFPHISSYCLTIEEKTVFGKWVKTGKMQKANEDYAARQFEMLMDTLEENDYEQYEISNFSLQGFRSQHNSNYWKQKKYLGIGPSAHSFDGTTRQFNIPNNALYMKSIDQNHIPSTVEKLSLADQTNEYLLTSLRTSWGCELQKLKTDFGHDLIAKNKNYIHDLLEKRMIQIQDDQLTLTRQGKLLADEITANLFLVEEK